MQIQITLRLALRAPLNLIVSRQNHRLAAHEQSGSAIDTSRCAKEFFGRRILGRNV